MIVYHAAYYRDPAGGYTVQVLDFPSVLSQGRTLDHARRMIADALRVMTEWLLEDGLPLPRPDPTITDPKAELIEPVQVIIRTRAGVPSP
jgi:predicted RNase H-like HicB family nuclease